MFLPGAWIRGQTNGESAEISSANSVSHKNNQITIRTTVKSTNNSLPLNGIIQNASFESPRISNHSAFFSFITSPTNSGWIFVNRAGIAKNGSSMNRYQTIGTTNGIQYAFLQGIKGTGSSISQEISKLSPGYYSFTLTASQRCTYGSYSDNSQNQSVTVLVDGADVGSFTPPDQNWHYYETAPILLREGNHSLTFTNIPVPGDAAILLDQVGIKEIDGTNRIQKMQVASTSPTPYPNTSTNQSHPQPPSTSYFGNPVPP